MSRASLFDAFDADPPAEAEPAFLSVAELTGRVKTTLERKFAEVALKAEVSNVARPRSGHVYLVLKDDEAQLRAVLWKSDAQKILFDLEDGLAVKVWGRLTVYPPRGEYQLTIRRIEPEGIGGLELAFRQTVARLSAEGLFDPSRKKPLPRFPRRIVVVTSPTGAAVRDFLQVTGRRWPSTEILIAPTAVQGPGAAEQVAEAIGLANRVKETDLIVVTRGGGSLEDLWAFNEEVVARAIAASRSPVISAIGHEVDVTIADLVADFRALTPSEAAERCVPDAHEIAQRLDRLSDRLGRAGRDRITQARDRLDRLGERATLALRRVVEDRRNQLARLASRLEALSPLGVLARGYSLTLTESGTPIRDAREVRPGDRVVSRLASGQILSRVEGTEPT
ncbi:MAG: exodeoxyribonuclease VII large subunit [Isosphaeraceae bacterium]